MFLSNLAHAGHDHAEEGGNVAAEVVKAAPQMDPLMLGVLLVGMAFVLPVLVYYITRSSEATVMSVLVTLFVVGAASYTVVPFVSVVFIVAGFLLSGLLVLGGLYNKK